MIKHCILIYLVLLGGSILLITGCQTLHPKKGKPSLPEEITLRYSPRVSTQWRKYIEAGLQGVWKKFSLAQKKQFAKNHVRIVLLEHIGEKTGSAFQSWSIGFTQYARHTQDPQTRKTHFESTQILLPEFHISAEDALAQDFSNFQPVLSLYEAAGRNNSQNSNHLPQETLLAHEWCHALDDSLRPTTKPSPKKSPKPGIFSLHSPKFQYAFQQDKALSINQTEKPSHALKHLFRDSDEAFAAACQAQLGYPYYYEVFIPRHFPHTWALYRREISPNQNLPAQ